jgi:hypothetical protein
MLDRWTDAKPWAEKKVSSSGSTATSATSATNRQSGRGSRGTPLATSATNTGFVADVANVAVDTPKHTFSRASLRTLDGRRHYRLATTRDGAVTPAAVALIAAATAAQVVVVADGSSLHIYTPISYRCSLHLQLAALAPDVLAVLQQQSAQRIDPLQPGPEDAESASAIADAFEERAASAEFEAGIPRVWAEGYAAMQRATPPAWTARHPGLWPDLINAVGKFLDRWARQAAELGWDPEDLFGAAPAAPLARSDQQGLVFFLQGGCDVVAMTADTATIRRPSGVVQTFRRPHKNARAPRTALVWELVTGGGGGP